MIVFISCLVATMVSGCTSNNDCATGFCNFDWVTSGSCEECDDISNGCADAGFLTSLGEQACAQLCETGPVTKVVAGLGETPQNTYYTKVTGLSYGATYDVDFQILRNDLGDASEYVTSVKIDGTNILQDGVCKPDGGDYDCTYYECQVTSAYTQWTAFKTYANLELSLTGHSWDCDCDESTWICSKESTVSGRTPVTAVGKFTFTPVPSKPNEFVNNNNCNSIHDATDDKYKVGNVELFAYGYNIFKGQPLTWNNKKDAGKTMQIFQIEYARDSDGNYVWTSSCNYLAIKGMGIFNHPGQCSYNSDSCTVTGMQSYKAQVGASLSISGEYSTAAVTASASMSTDYGSVQEDTSTNKMVFISAIASCVQTEIRNNIGRDGAEFTNAFVTAVESLATTTMTSPPDWDNYSPDNDVESDMKQEYYNFLKDWGTHYASSAYYGSKYGKRFKMSAANYKKLKEQNIDVEANAQASGYGASGSIDGSLTTSTEQKEFNDNVEKKEDILSIATTISQTDDSVRTWFDENADVDREYVDGKIINRNLASISDLLGEQFEGRYPNLNPSRLSIVKKNIQWAYDNYCELVKAFSSASIDCRELPPDPSIHQHMVQKMQYTTGIQDFTNNIERTCPNYENGNYVSKIMAWRQYGYGIVDFEVQCDQGEKITFTGNKNGWADYGGWFDGDVNIGFWGIETWRQAGYGIVNFRMTRMIGHYTEWSNGNTQTTQLGLSQCVKPAVIVGLGVKQMTHQGVINVRAICYDVGRLCPAGGYCTSSDASAEFIYGYQPGYPTQDTIDGDWVDLVLPESKQILCDKDEMNAKTLSSGRACRVRSHPDPTIWTNPFSNKGSLNQDESDTRPDDRCCNFGERCVCRDGQVRMVADTFKSDWKPVDSGSTSMLCDEKNGDFPQLDFSLGNDEKWCECRTPSSMFAEVEVAESTRSQTNAKRSRMVVKSHVNSISSESAPDSIINESVIDSNVIRLFACIGIGASMVMLYRRCSQNKEYENIGEPENEI